MNAMQYFRKHQCEGHHGQDANEVVLVDFDPDDSESTTLSLWLQPDGRLDLGDTGCPDTGGDVSDDPLDEIRARCTEWADIALDLCTKEEREEIEPDIRAQIEAIS